MDTFTALYQRRSIRDFDPERRIPEDILNKIIGSVRYSLPSPGGAYPWKIIAVRDKAVKNMIADCAMEVAKVMFGASYEIFGPGHLWYMPEDVQLRVAERTVSGELWSYPRDSDVAFLPCISRGAWTDSNNPFTGSQELLGHYVGFPTQNMWLVGLAEGIGAGYNGMPLLDIRRREQIVEMLGIPPSWEPTGAFCFGYASAPRFFGPARPSLEGVTFAEYWGNPYRRKGLEEARYEAMELPETDLDETMKNLNFVASFQDAPVPWWMIEKVLDVAIWGPLPENYKDIRLLVIKDKKSKEFIQKLRQEKKHDPFFFNWPELQYARAWHVPEEERLEEVEKVFDKGLEDWIQQAETLVIALTCPEQWKDQPYSATGAARMPMFSVSVGCCIQNMMIAATALGLGINYDVVAIQDTRSREQFSEYFGIPSAWFPLGILGLGMPGEKVKPQPKPSLESLIFDEYWGNPYALK